MDFCDAPDRQCAKTLTAPVRTFGSCAGPRRSNKHPSHSPGRTKRPTNLQLGLSLSRVSRLVTWLSYSCHQLVF
jgi:hypothetical protein